MTTEPQALPLCPTCGEPARDVLSTAEEGSPEAYECRNGHRFTSVALDLEQAVEDPAFLEELAEVATAIAQSEERYPACAKLCRLLISHRRMRVFETALPSVLERELALRDRYLDDLLKEMLPLLDQEGTGPTLASVVEKLQREVSETSLKPLVLRELGMTLMLTDLLGVSASAVRATAESRGQDYLDKRPGRIPDA